MRSPAPSIRTFAAAALLLLPGCAYSPDDFENDVGTAICECFCGCGSCPEYWTPCIHYWGPDPLDYRTCEFDPHAARKCARAWRRRDCSAPCPAEEFDWEWDSLEKCQGVWHSCGSRDPETGRWVD
jgi:hypothetical protein